MSAVRCRDETEPWRRERALVAWRATAPKLPAVGELPAIFRTSTGLPQRVTGELIIPAEPLAQGDFDHLPAVHVGLGGHLVEAVRIFPDLPCGGVLDGPELAPSPSFGEVNLSKTVRLRLISAIHALYEGLYRRFVLDGFQDWDERNVARGYLCAAALLMGRNRGLRNQRSTRLLERLEQMPLLELPNGRATSVEVARRERPRQLNGLGLWESRAREMEAVVELPAVGRGLPLPAATREERRGAGPPEEGERSPEEGERSPEERLLEAVVAELRLVRRAQQKLLGDADLELLTIADGEDDRAVICGPRPTDINGRHPAVSTALARFEEDPIWVNFLASAVYTAINFRRDEITDDDEARFHDRLAQHVISGLTGTKDA